VYWPCARERAAMELRWSCYVIQEDLFYANLTVLEHLTFQAELRMGRLLTAAERQERVDSVISEIGLSVYKTTLIGATFKGALAGVI
jgi:ABC-type multidrug transport system ATPase subunit